MPEGPTPSRVMLSVRVKPAAVEWVREQARKEGRPVSDVLRQVMKIGMAAYKPLPKETL